MADIKDLFRRLADELDKEERDELLEEMKGRKLTGEELLEAIKSLDPQARAEVRKVLAEVEEEIEEEKEKEKPKPKPNAEEEAEGEEEKPKPKRNVRPGRKSGRAYGWWVDENGKVIQLDIARVYSGEDEPDEVEMLPVEEKEEEEEVA